MSATCSSTPTCAVAASSSSPSTIPTRETWGRAPITAWRCASPRLPAASDAPRPCGQDNDEVLGELGIDAVERAELEHQDVIGRRPAAERIAAVSQHVVPYDGLQAAGLIEGRDPDYMARLGLERTAATVS